MKSLLGGTFLAISLVAMLASACGGEEDGSSASPAKLCNDVVATICRRVYQCVPAGLVPTEFGTSEASCISALKTSEGCDSLTPETVCEDNGKYQSDQARECVDQIGAASCAQLATVEGRNFDSIAPGCGMICAM